jgi:hypothetical protein
VIDFEKCLGEVTVLVLVVFEFTVRSEASRRVGDIGCTLAPPLDIPRVIRYRDGDGGDGGSGDVSFSNED